MGLYFLVNLRCQTSTIALSPGIKYFMRDLIFDVNYCSCAAFMRLYSSYNANDVRARSCITSL